MNSGYPLNNNNFNWERHIAKKIGSSGGGVDPSASIVAKVTDGQYSDFDEVPFGIADSTTVNEGWTQCPEGKAAYSFDAALANTGFESIIYENAVYGGLG